LFGKSGYFVARGGKRDLWQLVFIAPSLSITHKHRDNLQFTFWAGGVEWITDPGFFTYQPKDPVSAYARSADAHNALVVDGIPQGITPGTASLKKAATEGGFSVTGISNATEGLTSQRIISADLAGSRIAIQDSLSGGPAKRGDVKLMLQFGDGVHATMEDDDVRLNYEGAKTHVMIRLPGFGSRCRIVSAGSSHRKDGPGWIYPSFGVAVEADALLCRKLPSKLGWDITVEHGRSSGSP
jgi:hypothetical protein